MKKRALLLLVVLLLLSTNIFSQNILTLQVPSINDLTHSTADNVLDLTIMKGQSLVGPRIGQVGGVLLVLSGMPLIVGGVDLAIGGFQLLSFFGPDSEGVFEAMSGIGVVSALVGLLATGGGIVLIVKSSQKVKRIKKWSSTMDRQSTGISFYPFIDNVIPNQSYTAGVRMQITF